MMATTPVIVTPLVMNSLPHHPQLLGSAELGNRLLLLGAENLDAAPWNVTLRHITVDEAARSADLHSHSSDQVILLIPLSESQPDSERLEAMIESSDDTPRHAVAPCAVWLSAGVSHGVTYTRGRGIALSILGQPHYE